MEMDINNTRNRLRDSINRQFLRYRVINNYL